MTCNQHFNNINIFTEFGDLSPIQMLALFNTFINWPEYKESPFLATMESALVKMESTIDSDMKTDGLEIPDIDDHTIVNSSIDKDELYK